ncbi:MAG: tubulin/FtsZ family protein [Chloroflexota bacterium]
MKLLVVGCGQCGGRIADAFARLSGRAHIERGLEIITGCYAVNTDIADMTGLRFIKKDQHHRIVIGVQRTSGHGVGKVNELAAQIAREDSDKVMESMKMTHPTMEPDAFLLTASAGGGTGSGTIPVLTQLFKERFPEKPVYNLIVLPFKHEELTEERIILNTATCLKSSYLVADAIFLVDNQRFVKKSLSFQHNLAQINGMVAEPFYNVLCAGEEKKPGYIGSRTLDAGDIMQTLAGWTVIGYGNVPQHTGWGWLPFTGGADFRKKAAESQKEIQVLNYALEELSLKCNPRDANRALYLLCAPPDKMNMNLIREMGTALKNIAPDAIIRSGDYPRSRSSLEVAIILSELASVSKVTDYFNKVILYLGARKKKRGKEVEYQRLEDAFGDIPSLLE